MNFHRIRILLKKEIVHGPKDAVLAMSLLMPILLTLFINLAFGSIFTSKAKLGVYDAGSSQVTAILAANPGITLKIFGNEADLKSAVAAGKQDMGLVLPAAFDQGVTSNNVNLKAYVWGESSAQNRVTIPVVLADAIHQAAGASVPVEINSVPLGKVDSQPWSSRLLPLTVLMAVFFGGLMLPASSLINEKQKRTLQALNVTPATIGNIFWAKGIFGALVAMVMGILSMLLSGRFSGAQLEVILFLVLGAILAVEIGLLAGALIKDMNTLYAFWKFGGLLLFGPAVIFMFPQIPSWIGYLFPTYYVIRPLVDLSLSGASLASEALFLVVLIAVILLVGLLTANIVKRLSTQALRINA